MSTSRRGKEETEMIKESVLVKTTEALEKKLRGRRFIDLKLKNGMELLISRDGLEYTVYEGCELVIGDTSLRQVARTLILMNAGGTR